MAYRLLIIPGENEALRALPGHLAAEVEVRVLDTANDALWEVRNSPPEVIVADVQLPGMSGLDLAEILPNFGVPTKVVLWSRGSNRLAAKQAAHHGVYRFLNGPLSVSELQTVLYEALGLELSAITTPQAGTTDAEPVAVPEIPVATVATPAPAVTPPTSADFAASPAPAAKTSADTQPTPSAPTRSTPVETRPAPSAPASSTPASTPAPPPAAVTPPAATPPAATPAAATPPPAVRRPLQRRREGAMVLTADNLTPIRNRMDVLSQDVGSQCIMLTDRAGMVLTEVGTTATLPMMILLPLLSTSFSTASQIAQMLRETDSTALYMHEGSHYDLYCFDVLQRFMLVIVFDKAASAAKIGSVWVYAKRAIRDIQEFLV